MFELIINTIDSHNKIQIDSKFILAATLTVLSDFDMAEVWLTGDNGKSMALFTNKDRGMLLFLPDTASPGYSSRETVFPQKEELPIYMKDGQGDTKPVHYFVPLNKGVDALLYFFQNDDKDPTIIWHDDSLSE